jgi:hypothetical protein
VREHSTGPALDFSASWRHKWRNSCSTLLASTGMLVEDILTTSLL